MEGACSGGGRAYWGGEGVLRGLYLVEGNSAGSLDKANERNTSLRFGYGYSAWGSHQAHANEMGHNKKQYD